MLIALQMIICSVITFKSVAKNGIYLNVWLVSYLFQASPVNRRLIVSLSTGANKEMQSSFYSVNGFQVSTDTTDDPLHGTTRCVSNGEGPGLGKGKYGTQDDERLL